MPEHVPVMLMEVLDRLPLRPGARVVDGTMGLAGHSREMIDRIRPGGSFVGIDWDTEMKAHADALLAQEEDVTIRTFHADYRALPQCVEEAYGPAAEVDAILLDLGLNNAQIEDPSRGITFRADGPLDMRMDRSSGEPASAWLNRASESEIDRVLREYGDERWSRRIAKFIVEKRRTDPLRSTADLVACVEAAVPVAARDKRLHPATRTFQAVRIYINQELDELEEALVSAAETLAPGGVLVVLSYHSGEDRAAKQAMKRLATEKEFELIDRKPAVPTEEEVARNPKSRSCKLRSLRRIA
jgi:16S rRNA (cytosine1402-N4)-methyltransferase